MRVLDLTHTIAENMPVYPGTETPIFAGANTYEKDGFKETMLSMFSHTGTHMDAPAHMLLDGAALDSYPGEFCIESFDPFALIDVKKLRPEICRGQLSMNFEKDKAGLPWYKRFIAGNLLLNFLTVPDFIAYKFEDRSSYCLRSCVRVWGAQEVDWTIRTKEDLLACEAAGGIPIFERFDPEV